MNDYGIRTEYEGVPTCVYTSASVLSFVSGQSTLCTWVAFSAAADALGKMKKKTTKKGIEVVRSG